MISFLLCIAALIAGYFTYGKVVEKFFGPDPARKTPAIVNADGVDYVPMPAWKVFMIQFLNIAGTGPIFGAIMGAKFGPSCYIWIVLGSIFAGGVHDYMSGMMSVRGNGRNVPSIVGHFLGNWARTLMMVFTMILLLLVGTTFVYSPALILGDIAGFFSDARASIMFWVLVVFLYYMIATMVPIDKLIGRIYPLFAFCLLFMAVSLFACLIVKWPTLPEFWDGLQNRGPSTGMDDQPIFPCLFITVACGAISGFHSTQSPLMAKCIQNEKLGRPIFYGAMITEGIVALIWAAVSSWFFFDGGMEALGATSGQAPEVVVSVSKGWLGIFGGILAILGVVIAPITSGDTAFRSARMVIAEFIGLDQKKIGRRFIIALPMFAAAAILLWYNISDPNGFNKIWRYFGLANQALATIVLWAISAFLTRKYHDLRFLATLIPAALMTAVCITYLCVDKTCLGLSTKLIPYIAVISSTAMTVLFFIVRKHKRGIVAL